MTNTFFDLHEIKIKNEDILNDSGSSSVMHLKI